MILTRISFLFLVTFAFALDAMAADRYLSIVQVHFKSPENSLVGKIEKNKEYARTIATGLGFHVAAANRVELQDQSGDSLSKQLIQLRDSLVKGDRLFLYYAGHGTAFAYQNACTAALVTADETAYPMDWLDEYMTGLQAKGIDVVAVFDTCFSGGAPDDLKTRDLGASKKPFTGNLKDYFVPIDQCGIPVNSAVDAQKMRDASAEGARGNAGSVTVISTAADNEVAIGIDSWNAGIGTVFLAECAKQLKGNAVQVGEFVNCAQGELEKFWMGVKTADPPQHYQWAGNKTLTRK